MKSIFVAVPHYGAIVPDALPGLFLASTAHRVFLNTQGGSLLAHNFNKLWAAALNDRETRRLTHFAMHHADVSAPAGWLDTLVDEMERVQADVISCVIPIKDARGLSSTGCQDRCTHEITRLTMSEVFKLPLTFNENDLPPNRDLMINTGLWVCDFTRPWVDEVCFEIRDGINRTSLGQHRATVLPEDWNFSGWCARRGLRVFATRKVPVTHFGTAPFRNTEAWGTWSSDRGDE